jgi:hypothetical protein
MDMPSDDQAQDMAGEFGDEPAGDGMGDEMGADDMGGEEELEDRVMDLEDALEELKREFDDLMADEKNEPEHNDGIDDPDFGGEDDGEEEMGDEEEAGEEEAGEEDEESLDEASEEETVEEAAEEEEEESLEESAEEDEEEEEEETVEESKQFRTKSVAELMREYVEKVSTPENTEGKGVGNAGRVATVYTKNPVAGKNDMGGTTKNIARGSGGQANPDGKSAPSSEKPKDLIGKVQNTAGGSKKLEAAKKPTTSQASGTNKNSVID